MMLQYFSANILVGICQSRVFGDGNGHTNILPYSAAVKTASATMDVVRIKRILFVLRKGGTKSG